MTTNALLRKVFASGGRLSGADTMGAEGIERDIYSLVFMFRAQALI